MSTWQLLRRQVTGSLARFGTGMRAELHWAGALPLRDLAVIVVVIALAGLIFGRRTKP
jgi:hypothetical protein